MKDLGASNDPMPSRRTRLLRGAADRALSEVESAELAEHLVARPKDRAVIDFENQLRTSLQRSLGSEHAPEHVRERVRELARKSVPQPRSSLVRWLVAAVVVLGLGLGLWKAFPRNPDQFGFDGRGPLVQFLATHSMECPITIERTIQEFHVRRVDEAVSTLGTLLGQAPLLAGLGQTDLEFRGMGRCGIPGNELSMHLMFAGAMGSALEGAMLNLYVQRDDGRLPISEGTTYQLQPKTQEFSALQMFVWKRQGLDYFVVTANPEAGRIALAKTGAPEISALL